MLENLRSERDDLGVVLGAEFARNRPEDARALRVAVFANDDDGVAVETEVAAVSATKRGLGANDDGLDDLALLHGGIGAALFNIDGNDIAHVGVPGGMPGLADHRGAARTGVVGDIENGTHLDHGGISWCGLGLGGGGLRDGLGGLGRNGLGDILLGNRGGGAHGSLDDADHAPALEAADRAGLHDLDLVAHLGLVLLVMDVKDGLAVDDLVVKRVRRLVRDGDLDGLVAHLGADEADLGLAAIVADVSGHGCERLAPAASGSLRGFLLLQDGLQARDVLAVGAQEVRLLDLAGILAQAELEELLAGLAELRGDLARGEVADFFGSHGGLISWD